MGSPSRDRAACFRVSLSLPCTLHRRRNAVDAQEERMAQRILRFLLPGGPVHDAGAVKCGGHIKKTTGPSAHAVRSPYTMY